jgi:hypothetical protein
MRLMACLFLLGSAYGQTNAPDGLQNKLRNEVSQWAQKTHQLEADQFSFAPMDARVQVQSCDRPLVMDLPFATRETVRVRCLGSPYWQLYMRLVLKPGVTLAGAPASAPQVPAPAASAAVAAAPPKVAASAPPAMVVTTPFGSMRRMRAFPESATKTTPVDLTTATSLGPLKASNPAIVATWPDFVILRIALLEASAA